MGSPGFKSFKNFRGRGPTYNPNPKPNPDIYKKALTELGIKPTECIAIEDTETSMKAALTANIDCVAFPGQISQGNSFDGAKFVTEKLSPNYFIT